MVIFHDINHFKLRQIVSVTHYIKYQKINDIRVKLELLDHTKLSQNLGLGLP